MSYLIFTTGPKPHSLGVIDYVFIEDAAIETCELYKKENPAKEFFYLPVGV